MLFWKKCLSLGMLAGLVGSAAQAQPPAAVDGPMAESPTASALETRPEVAPQTSTDPDPLGPTPLNKVGILQGLIFGDNADKSKIKIMGWMDFDYTFRSTG